MIAQIVVFSRKTDAQRKKNFAFRSAKIAQKFCEWKPYSCVIITNRHPKRDYYFNYYIETRFGTQLCPDFFLYSSLELEFLNRAKNISMKFY